MTPCSFNTIPESVEVELSSSVDISWLTNVLTVGGPISLPLDALGLAVAVGPGDAGACGPPGNDRPLLFREVMD